MQNIILEERIIMGKLMFLFTNIEHIENLIEEDSSLSFANTLILLLDSSGPLYEYKHFDAIKATIDDKAKEHNSEEEVANLSDEEREKRTFDILMRLALVCNERMNEIYAANFREKLRKYISSIREIQRRSNENKSPNMKK